MLLCGSKVTVGFKATLVGFVLVLTLASFSSTPVFAISGINQQTFSLYSYLGGLWNFHVVDNSPVPVADDVGGGGSSSSFASKLVDAFSPDFGAACQTDGRAQFPQHKIFGFPQDADLTIENGKSSVSEVLACSLWSVAGGRGHVGDVTRQERGAEGPLDNAFVIVVPTSVNRAVAYKTMSVASMSPKLRNFFSSKLFSSSSSSSSDNNNDAANKNKNKKEKDKFVNEAHVVTHKAEVRVQHQGSIALISAAGVSSKAASVLSAAASSPDKSVDLAQATGIFLPVSGSVAKALKEEEEQNARDNVCRVEITRFSAVLTTVDDALVTVGVRSSNCPSPKQLADGAAVPKNNSAITNDNKAQQEELEEAAAQKKSNNKRNRHSSAQHNVEPAKEQLILLNSKRFASIEDEEATLSADAAWYEKRKFGPTIGAFVLLFVLVGGRKAVKWFLKKRGVDVDKFMMSTKGKGMEELKRLRAERMKMKGGDASLPMTDEEVSRLQEQEQEEFAKQSRQATADYANKQK